VYPSLAELFITCSFCFAAHILTSPIASSLPTLPFNVLRQLFDSTLLTTDDGVLLRRMTLDIGAIHLILACLSVLSHHAPRQPIPGFHQDIILSATKAAGTLSASSTPQAVPKPPPAGTTAMSAMDDKSQNYWAKGTGFGTGSTASSWDAEQALLRQKSEEEHVTCLLQVLASYIHPSGQSSAEEQLPSLLPELLSHSCLVPAISSYLRNDSVLDMARHVPLYRALLELLRGLASCTPLVPLLLPLPEVASDDSAEASTTSVSCLLEKMRSCVDTYASRLKYVSIFFFFSGSIFCFHRGKSSKEKSKAEGGDEESEGLAKLIPDIQQTARIVDQAIHQLQQLETKKSNEKQKNSNGVASSSRLNHSQEERYMAVMRELQFGMF
jgi:baculoviral IAP repeat-containing protein 6